MIAKAKSISHGAKGIDYALNKDGAEIIDKQLCIGDNGNEIMQEFGIFQDLNDRATNKEISFVLSPHVDDGKTLSNEKFKELKDEFLKEMGLENHQSIAIKHTDKDHVHLHIFVNRINMQGNCYNDEFISNRSSREADKVAERRGLKRASEIQKLREEKHKDVKKEIFQKHKEALSRSKGFEEYKNNMDKLGVKVNPTINKQGNMQGFRMDYKGHDFKASEVNRKMTLSKMEFPRTPLKNIENVQQMEREKRQEKNNEFKR